MAKNFRQLILKDQCLIGFCMPFCCTFCWLKLRYGDTAMPRRRKHYQGVNVRPIKPLEMNMRICPLNSVHKFT